MSNRTSQIAETTIVVGGNIDVKSAALFFKYIFPISFSRMPVHELHPPFFHGFNQQWTFEDSLLGAIRASGYEHLIDKGDFVLGVEETGHILHGRFKVKEGCDEDVNRALISLIETSAQVPTHGPDFPEVTTFREALSAWNFKGREAPVYGVDLLGRTDKKANEILLTISGVPWINLTNTEWTQIIEFRKDSESLKKFRNFRHFASTTYSEKSPEFIQDDFLQRIEEFELARIKHGFNLQTSTIKSVIKSKYILGGGLGGVLAWMFGGIPESGVIGSAALLSGVCVEFANVALDIRAANFELNHNIEGHELSYAISAKNALEA